MLPAAVFSGVRRVADYALEYIPSMTQEEFAFLMKIPGMRVRVNDTDYSADERKSDRPREQDPDVRNSVLFYHLPRHDGKELAKSIVSVLSKLKIRELRSSRAISAYGGVPMWDGKPFLARYREQLAAYKKRTRGESGGCTIL
jgi:hypothetical protein